ncbi:MAG: hypothetical protein IT293_20735 [Deltaproteobacteria bacterium]|nr:hypothetical protein [Deltaproteobacteria bacterium]
MEPPPADDARLPRAVEASPRAEAVRAALRADARPLRTGGALAVAHVPMTATLRSMLATLGAAGRLVRGLETAEEALAGERRGLAALPEEIRRRQGSRVSRVLVMSADGADRFHRQVERLVLAHAPRVVACRVDCTSAELGAAAFGPGEVAKLVLSGRKAAAVALLEALAGP